MTGADLRVKDQAVKNNLSYHEGSFMGECLI